MLAVTGLTKKFGQKIANDNVSLSLDEGEIGILLGPNGAGKSTVIKCILGLLRYDGEVTIGGYPARSSKAKAILGYVPEFPSLYEMLTVTEHLEFIIRAYRLDRLSAQRYALELMECFRLTEMKDTLCKDLSKGMQQKVSIICALLPHPRLLLLDEPMLGLDPYAIKELRSLVTELAETGVAVLISTHMISTVEGIWQKAYIMRQGKVISSHRKEEMIGVWAESLERIFFADTESYEPEDDRSYIEAIRREEAAREELRRKIEQASREEKKPEESHTEPKQAKAPSGSSAKQKDKKNHKDGKTQPSNNTWEDPDLIETKPEVKKQVGRPSVTHPKTKGKKKPKK